MRTKSYSVIFSVGQIIVARIPFTDIPVSKARPAVVLAVVRPDAISEQLLCAMITSARKSVWPFDPPIADLDQAGVRGPSVVRLRLFTLDSSVMTKTVGSLSSNDLAWVRRAGDGLIGPFLTSTETAVR